MQRTLLSLQPSQADRSISRAARKACLCLKKGLEKYSRTIDARSKRVNKCR